MKWNGMKPFHTLSPFLCLVVEEECNQLVRLKGIHPLDAECMGSTELVEYAGIGTLISAGAGL